MRELTAKNNAVLMNFNTRDVRDINIINHINHKAKKIHRKREEQFEPLEQLTPAKPFSSLYASPTEAPMAQLNRFYIPERIRATPTDGVDVGSQIQEMTRSYQQVPETKQTVVPPAKGEEFGVQTETPEGFGNIVAPIPEMSLGGRIRRTGLKKADDLSNDEIMMIEKNLANAPKNQKTAIRKSIMQTLNISEATLRAVEARIFGGSRLQIAERLERAESYPITAATPLFNQPYRESFSQTGESLMREYSNEKVQQPQPSIQESSSIEEIEVPKQKSKKSGKKTE